MWKAYALGFFSAAVAVLLVAVLWLGTGKEDQGLLWGGTVYTSKLEFDQYLKSNGLSYKEWAAKHVGRAPWEPDEIQVGAITLRISSEARDAWVVRLPLAAIGLMLLSGLMLLLLRGLREFMPGLATRPVAFVSAVMTVLLVTVIWFGT